MRHRGMQIERHVERLGTREDRPEALVVDANCPLARPWIMAPLKPSAVTQRSELVGGSIRHALVGSAAEACEAAWDAP